MAKTLRWGILGTAGIAKKNWLAIHHTGNSTVAAVASRDPARSSRFIAECQQEAPMPAVPTAFGAPPLSALISAAPGEAPVWPHAEGQARGPSLNPLHRYVPEAALADRALYELLALLDALRAGRSRSRERTLAQKLLSERLRPSRAA